MSIAKVAPLAVKAAAHQIKTLSCNNNFAKQISAVVPSIQSEHQGLLFKDWIPLAINKSDWLNTGNAYFESCKTIDEDCEEEKDPNNT